MIVSHNNNILLSTVLKKRLFLVEFFYNLKALKSLNHFSLKFIQFFNNPV